MSLSPCRECGHQVSSEAIVCPHCGVGYPATEPERDVAANTEVGDVKAAGAKPNKTITITAVVSLLLAGAVIGGYEIFDRRGINASGDAVEATIVERFRSAGNLSLSADCPRHVRLRKGKITDCSLTRLDTGKSTPVYVTGVDNEGHFQMQLGDASVLVEP